MIVGYGSRIPKGRLPVYSVADEREARDLLIMTCPTTQRGEFVAPELAEEQTLANLQAFSDRLHATHAHLQATGQCRCTPAEGE